MRMLLILAAATILTGADAPDDVTARELKKFQGAWELATGEAEGRKIKTEHLEGSKIVREGDACTLMTPHQSDGEIHARITKVSPGRGEIEWTRESGPHKGSKVVAIYEFPDADHDKVRFHPAGKSKPESFATQEGSGHIFHTWKRLKK